MSCPYCGSDELMLIGRLGGRTHYRCRHCGGDSSKECDENSEEPEDDQEETDAEF